ncbi:Glutamate cysteine ligase regulatory subunit [Echinococcus multilocularis]|uniref:GCS light chain n=1 Tax=Echinococcus multilocularis TaxID=6211 RepID=A0A068YG87_ECHMU|nr:Glutamate cysteine ligase regulatory subunit [Echinococcus multilocularis]
MSEFPKARQCFLHTSNILKWNNMQLIRNPFEEVETCIRTVMHCWHSRRNADLCEQETLCIACDKHRDKIPESERSNVIVSAKLFLFTDDHDSIRQAVNKTLDRLGLEDLETLIISLSPELSRGALVDHPPCMGLPWARIPQNTAHSLLKIWPVLEEFVEGNKIFRLGVSDMPVTDLEALCAAVKIPPKVNQVFIGSTCLLGDELENFAKLHSIQLLTHHDSADMLPEEKLQAVMRNEFSAEDAVGWRPSWLMRYAEYYKNRGVVRSRGYTLFAERDLPASMANTGDAATSSANGDQRTSL